MELEICLICQLQYLDPTYLISAACDIIVFGFFLSFQEIVHVPQHVRLYLADFRSGNNSGGINCHNAQSRRGTRIIFMALILTYHSAPENNDCSKVKQHSAQNHDLESDAAEWS